MAGDLEAVPINFDGFAKALSTPVTRRRLYFGMAKRLRGHLGQWLRRDFIGRTFRRYRTASGGNVGVMHTRTGSLVRSFRVERHGEDIDSLRFLVGSFGLPYAAIQEFGGTIKKKGPGFLTIPVGAALTPAGVPRFTARQALQQPGVHFVKGKRGPLIVRDRKTRSEVLFVLRKQVKIKPRLGFFKAWEAQMPTLVAHFNAAIGEALDGK